MVEFLWFGNSLGLVLMLALMYLKIHQFLKLLNDRIIVIAINEHIFSPMFTSKFPSTVEFLWFVYTGFSI